MGSYTFDFTGNVTDFVADPDGNWVELVGPV